MAEIDWDDPDAVAALRGDNVTDEVDEAENDVDTEKQTDEVEAKAEETEVESADGDGDDADDTDADDSDTKASDKEPLIPKSRLDSKNKQLKEERARSEELERKLAEADKRDATAAKAQTVNQQQQRMQVLNDAVADLGEKVIDAIADGDRKLAAKLQSEQRVMEREIVRIEMQESAVETRSQTKEEVRLDLTIDQLEEMYPQLDPDGDDFDAKLVENIQELRLGFLNTGKYSASQALLKAVSTYIKDEDRVKEAPVQETDGETEVQKTVKAERKQKALKKSVKAQKQQPPDLKGVGDDADTAGIQGEIDANKLTLDDLEKMPMDQLKKLRGDYRV